MFGIGNQSSNNSDNNDNSNNTSSLQQASNNRTDKNNEDKNKKTLSDHASDALMGLNSFMANANRRQQANNGAN